MKLSIIFICTFLGISPAFADIVAIDFQQISRFSQLQEDVDFLAKNYRFFEYWTPKWDYSLDKASAISSLSITEAKIEKLLASENKNLDLSLLLLTVYQYQYNLEVSGNRVKFDALMLSTLKDFPNDYRPIWFKAEFLGNAGRLVDSVREYQMFIRDNTDLENIHPKALYDYAYVCSEAGLFRTSMISLTQFAKRASLNLDEIPLYKTVKKTLVPSTVSEPYSGSRCWDFSSTETENSESSRIFGISIANPKEWKTSVSDYKNGTATLQIVPPAITSSLGSKITIHIGVSVDTHVDSLESGEKLVKARYGSKFSIRFQEDRKVGGMLFKVFQVTSSDLYKERGGLYGYMALAENVFSQNSGFNIEVPRELDVKTGMGFYIVNPQQDRLSSNIGYCVIVDSCSEIRNETDAIFSTLLKGIRAD